MLAVGTNLAQNDAGVVDALPFVAATALVAGLPFLAFLLFHRRAVRVLPKVRDWTSPHAWLINIVVNCFFIFLILA